MRLTLHTVGRIRLTVHPVLWYKNSRVLPGCQAQAARVYAQTAIATTLAGLADIAALRAELAELRARVAALEHAKHGHPGIVPTRKL